MAGWSFDAINKWIYPAITTDILLIGATSFGTGTGTRMYFDPTTNVFRAGSTNSSQWDTANLGANSACFGANSKASGAYSFAAGNTNFATGSQSMAVCSANTVSGTGSFACGGGNTVAGTYAFAGCSNGVSSGDYSATLGNANTASGTVSTALGGQSIASRQGQLSFGAQSAVVAYSQVNMFHASRKSTSATPVVLYFDATTATLTGATTNVLTIPVSKVHRFVVQVAARRTDSTSDAAGFEIKGTIVRGASGSATFISTPVVTADLTAGASTWTVVPTIDTSDGTNNYLVLTATGQSGASISWSAHITTVEIGS